MERDIGCDCCWFDNALDQECPNCGQSLLDADPAEILSLTFGIKGRGPATHKYTRVCKRTCAYRGSIALMGAQIKADTKPAHYDPLPPGTKKVYLIGWFKCRMALVYVHGADVPYLVVLGEVTHGILCNSQWWMFSLNRRLTSNSGVTWDFDKLPTTPTTYMFSGSAPKGRLNLRLLAVSWAGKRQGHRFDEVFILLQPQASDTVNAEPSGDPICLRIPSSTDIASLAMYTLGSCRKDQPDRYTVAVLTLDPSNNTNTWTTNNTHAGAKANGKLFDGVVSHCHNDVMNIPYYKPKKHGLPFRFLAGCKTMGDYGVKMAERIRNGQCVCCSSAAKSCHK